MAESVKVGERVQYGDWTGTVEAVGRAGRYARIRTNKNDTVLPSLDRVVHAPINELTVLPPTP